jgi:hypothetical protein
VALFVAVIMPAYSWRDGSGWLAWTMFSKSQTYRLAVTVSDTRGVIHAINPSELTRVTGGDVQIYLAGAEHFRHAPVGGAFRRELPVLARLACQLVPQSARADVRLDFRSTLDSPVEVTTAGASCVAGSKDESGRSAEEAI